MCPERFLGFVQISKGLGLLTESFYECLLVLLTVCDTTHRAAKVELHLEKSSETLIDLFVSEYPLKSVFKLEEL
jgi:hypothetical protein